MASKGKEVASASTPSRARKTKYSSRGRENNYPEERFDSREHYEKSKTLEGRGNIHERIIRFPEADEDFISDMIQGLGWGFMYSVFRPINMTVVREFYSNIPTLTQKHVFLRGKNIPISEEAMHRHLGITNVLPSVDEDDVNKATVIGREGITWANDLADTTIPNGPDNAILNANATAWHKLIMTNIDPKTHVTTFLMEHALFIFVLMIEGLVNLPRTMRDVMVKRPSSNTRNLIPYPMFIMRLADQY
ncbi:hypothetical protein PIB30_023387 [Stylosanthes scabra]|uniref:Putative plant transposon protein domain-containing protein n=1 Tax=Stylosanthes scabra TaxID=79078 RepID=A0ABU6V8L0_9FABA|nr:hypothetical protein [Stylosanthes scabra]